MTEIQLAPDGWGADVTWRGTTVRVAYVDRTGRLVVDGAIRAAGPCVFPIISGPWVAWKAAPDWEVIVQRDGDSAFYGPFPATGWAAGNHPCEFSEDGKLFAYQDAAQIVHVLAWPSGVEQHTTQGSAEGIQQITPAGDVMLYGDNHASQPGMNQWQSVGDWIAGSNIDDRLGIMGCVVRKGNKQRLLFAGHNAEMPRCALSPDGLTLAVVCGIVEGVWFGTVTEADLTEEVPVPTPPPPPPDPVYAAGFSGPVTWGRQESAETYAFLRQKGWTVARVDCQGIGEADLPGAIRTVQLAGLRIIAILEPHQVAEGCPRTIDVEYLNEREAMAPAEYARQVLAVADVAARKHLRQWVGAISNPSPASLAWLRQVLALLPWLPYGVSIHRYPPAWNAGVSAPRPEYPTRAAEIAAIRAVIGTRPLIVTEIGWRYVTQHGWFAEAWPFWPHTHTLPEQTVATLTRQELTYWKAQLADQSVDWPPAVAIYQINDSPTGPPDFGMRATNGRWKPIVDPL